MSVTDTHVGVDQGATFTWEEWHRDIGKHYLPFFFLCLITGKLFNIFILGRAFYQKQLKVDSLTRTFLAQTVPISSTELETMSTTGQIKYNDNTLNNQYCK